MTVMIMGVSEVNAALFSGCFNEVLGGLYKTGVEKEGDITITHLVFAADADIELVEVSCDVVINHQLKTLKVLPVKGNYLEVKCLDLIKKWIGEQHNNAVEYTWEIQVE